MSIQSMRSEGASLLGDGLMSSAPAPSESIQRRNSLLKGNSGWSSHPFMLSLTCGSKCEALRLGEASSEPVTTALSDAPAPTLRKPYLRALTPEQHTPLVPTISHGGQPSSACTMLA